MAARSMSVGRRGRLTIDRHENGQESFLGGGVGGVS